MKINKFYKCTLVNGIALNSFIDVGSRKTLLMGQEARSLLSTWNKDETETLISFGISMAMPIGSCDI